MYDPIRLLPIAIFGTRLIQALARRAALSLCCLVAASAAAASEPSEAPLTPPGEPSYKIEATFSIDPTADAGRAAGTMTISDWPSGDPSGSHCLYLPYADPDDTFDPIRDFDLVPRKYAKAERHQGAQHAWLQTPGLIATEVSPFVLEIHGEIPAAGLRLRFDAMLPRWPDGVPDEWVYSDFHPLALVHCPADPKDSRSFTIIPAAKIDATIAAPAGFTLASPGLAIGQRPQTQAAQGSQPAHDEYELKLDGRKLVVAALKGFNHWALPVPGTSVEVYFQDPSFEKLIPAMQNALSVQTAMFGPPPFPHLVILETAEVEKSSLPGMIAVNHPRQAGMAELQSDVLNWSDWQVTSFVAEQWFGASMTTRSLDDLWLLRGFVDFATIESLAASPSRYSLMRATPDDPGNQQINFDYRQTQDLIAAALTYLHPYNALTGPDYKSLEPFSAQHSLSYMRHGLALRQINWTLGRERFRELLRKFAQQYRGQIISPQAFGEFYEREVSKLAPASGFGTVPGAGAGVDAGTVQAAKSYLRQWWTADDWPDFELLDVDDEDLGSTHRVRVKIGQHNGYSLPVTATVTDVNGKTYEAMAHQDADTDTWTAELTTDAKSDVVEVDHSHQLFDWDRFNNKNAWPDVNFFPGNARTFADDAYSVLWLPLASELPGQPVTLMLVGEGFRYMHNSMTGIITYQPDTHIAGYSFYYLTDFPKLASYLVLDSYENKGLSYANERLEDAGFYKTVSIIKNPYIEYGLRLRNRERLGDESSQHQTIAFKSLVQPLNQYGPCNYSAKLELEHTLQAQSPTYRYDRDFGIAEGTCKASDWFELGLRGFTGQLTRKEFAAGSDDNVRFHPQDVDEARLRIDEPSLARVDSINAFAVDLLLPAALPIPDSFYVLKRETRYRIFADIATSRGPDLTYHDAGVGLWIPMGGDLVGKGSVSVLNFSALVVLFRQAGDYHSSVPGFLFDFDFFGKI